MKIGTDGVCGRGPQKNPFSILDVEPDLGYAYNGNGTCTGQIIALGSQKLHFQTMIVRLQLILFLLFMLV
jgi:hypothetical protein